MKLVLAEKPSVAQSIAKVLGATKREDGYLEGNGYVVSWCVGHLVELSQPEAYDEKYNKWAYLPLREYQSSMTMPPLVRQFITDDEINESLSGGSGFSGGKARIYEYWQKGHSAKEKADFLKNEYGTGGRSHALSGASGSGEDHDAKGIRYTKSGCDKVQLSWTQVANRIDSLIKQERYISPEVLKDVQQERASDIENEPNPVGRIEYLGTNGRPGEVIEYTDPEQFIKNIEDETFYGVPFTVVLYRDEQGNTIPQDFLSELDPPPKGFRVEDAPVIDLEEEAPSVDEAEESPFVAQVMRDVEAIAAEEESYERFSVIETENGYAVWDDIRDEIYVDDEGVSEEFTSEWQANDYLQEVKKAVSAKESAEWLYNERSKFEATQEPVYQVGDTVFLEGEAYNITAIGTTDVQLLPPGMVYPIYRAESKENFERLLRQDERNARFISGEEPEKTVATAEPEHFIDHYYVVEDLQVRGALQLKEYSTFEDAMRAYKSLPSERMKALGVQNTRTPFPGSLDLIQCKDGEDKLVQDYTKVAGWENPEILDLVQKIETAIQTKESPDIPAINFHITNDHLGEGGAKAKFRANMDAIRVLKELEFDERNATPEEQEILSQYVGWGGLAAAFDENKASWAEEFRELYTALSPEEYAAARASTLNAHYTSPTVIRAIYDAVGQMGFETGNILEPAMGIGNFFGMLPDAMRNSNLYGVELDSISGRIAQKLYPNAEIKVAGFETTDRRDFYDLAVGNVPFGNYKVSDKPYDKLGFSIHNYFFAKTLDQVRPGGVVAFVTSRFTMDSKNSDARKYMAQRAELLGAIRLPNTAFKANAGTEVVSDIIFLQKRDHPIDIMPDWVQLNTTPDGYTMNSYFVEHPEMVLGELSMESTQYGKDDLTVRPREDMELADLLREAVTRIGGTYAPAELTEEANSQEKEQITIPARPDVKNFSYTVVDDEVYFRENSVMRLVELNDKAKERVSGMVELRRIVNELIEYQLEDYPDDMIQAKQVELNAAYDAFTAKNGLINNRANSQAFADDSSYYLLCSLENLDEDGHLKSKADMFTKRTIKPERKVNSVDTPSEALAISIGEHGKVDLPYMAELLGTPGEYDSIKTELQGVIFKDPMAPDDPVSGWQTADEYLSGDVRSKLRIAQMAAQKDSSFEINVQALEKAQPKDLDASEIDVRLGATWIDSAYIQQFMQETFETPYYLRRTIEVKFSELTAEWRINGKSSPSQNDVAAYTTYGTERANAYRILEETLNLKDIRIYDTIEDADGKQKRVLNKKETTLAQQKQQAIKDAFRDWIWKDSHRREALVTKYNELFNSTRPREYDGSHIRFGGMNPDITLREHQRNAIAHVLYVTEGTFDAYLYQTLENKQKFISQIMTSKSPVRSCDDVDEQALSYAEIKALCAGNPLIKEKMDLDIDVARLKVLKADHQSQQYRMEDKLLKYFPAEIERQTGYIRGFEADIQTVTTHPQIVEGFCGMEILGKHYMEKEDAGEMILAACKEMKATEPIPLGSYRGFQMELSFDSFRHDFDITLKGAVSHRVSLGTDARGNIIRLDNALSSIPEKLEKAHEQLTNLQNQQEATRAELGKPFPQEAELAEKSARLAELDAALNMEDSMPEREEAEQADKPSVLADLKAKSEHIPPYRASGGREEVL